MSAVIGVPGVVVAIAPLKGGRAYELIVHADRDVVGFERHDRLTPRFAARRFRRLLTARGGPDRVLTARVEVTDRWVRFIDTNETWATQPGRDPAALFRPLVAKRRRRQ